MFTLYNTKTTVLFIIPTSSHSFYDWNARERKHIVINFSFTNPHQKPVLLNGTKSKLLTYNVSLRLNVYLTSASPVYKAFQIIRYK